MEYILIVVGIILLIACVLIKFSNRTGIPFLLLCIVAGLILGKTRIFNIEFHNLVLLERVASLGLVFIMFYGGFGTNKKKAEPVIKKAVVLSTLGVFLTAVFSGLFCHYVLKMSLPMSLLVAAVTSSTDAASVFSILKNKNLALKENTDSLLEMESGSNDPMSYMLTVIALSLIKNSIDVPNLLLTVFLQFAVGIGVGVLFAFGSVKLLRNFRFSHSFDQVYVMGAVVLAFGVTSLLKGNGYLAVYLFGIILGNSRIPNKVSLVHFYDGVTEFLQIMIFFLLGLLVRPKGLISMLLPAFLFFLFITFIGRPLATYILLAFFKNTSKGQKILTSFAGLRGVASVVFAIMALSQASDVGMELFNLVFCLVILSILFQGSLIPFVAKKTNMVDDTHDILETFNDYVSETALSFFTIEIEKGHAWENKKIYELQLPQEMLIVSIIRNKISIIPNGNTIILEKDKVKISAISETGPENVDLDEIEINDKNKWIGKTISAFSKNENELVILIMRDSNPVIPTGDTILMKNDLLYLRREG